VDLTVKKTKKDLKSIEMEAFIEALARLLLKKANEVIQP
jgi:hypothetical protein